jgi:chromosome segregation ATPase
MRGRARLVLEALFMIETTMYFAIGFLVAALFGLLFAPLLHNRAVRLTKRRLDAATPLSIIEVRADKDQLRAQFAMSIRRLEMSIEQMKTKTTMHLVEISKKTDTITELKKELGEKTATISAMEARDKILRNQPSSTEKLHEADRALADKEAQLAKQAATLAHKSRLLDEREFEIKRLREQLDDVGETENDLRSELVVARGRSRSVAELHSEIDRLEAKLYTIVEARSERQRDIAIMRRS